MPKITSPANTPVLNRRTVFMGAGAIGAVGAVAVASTASKVLAPPAVVAEVDPPNTGGYQLTEHVKQYYATARM